MLDSYPVIVEQVLCRICSEYLEMPGLRLTQKQAQRLWGLDEQTCGEALHLLLEARFLQQTRDATFIRVTDGPAGFPLHEIVRGALRPKEQPMPVH